MPVSLPALKVGVEGQKWGFREDKDCVTAGFEEALYDPVDACPSVEVVQVGRS